MYDRSLASPIDFWQEQMHRIAWYQLPGQVLAKDDQHKYRWYRGGQLNTAFLALDYHIDQGRGDQTALIYDSPVTGSTRRFTFQELRDEVARLAGMLRSLGVGKGDRVIIYMPMIPQTVMAMLACARIGAVHSVVFGGFAAHELAIRIDDARPRILLTASGAMEVDRKIEYLPIVTAALEEATHKPERCVVYQRSFLPVNLPSEHFLDWEERLGNAQAVGCVPVEATDPLYILYTSGTTGKPKGIIRDNGGHAVAMSFSMEYVYGAQPGDVFWAASDVGWVVGHSYIVYGPLIHGCTTILYEGKPVRTPDAGAFWRVIEAYGVNIFFTAPTALRAIRKEDPEGKLKANYNTSSLRYQFLAGERCDTATLEWTSRLLEVPVIDHWWQTESGWPMLANMAGAGLLPVKKGSAGKPVCGFDIRILDNAGQELPANAEGAVVVALPLPPGCLPDLWENTPRFIQAYLATYPGFYLSGDGGYRDEEGYVFITGRIDDLINVAGHRLSTAEMEEVVAAHPAVAECAVIGVADQLKGQIPVGFVVLKSGQQYDPVTIQNELIGMVRQKIGPVASFKKVIITSRLPKTRSGKILRKIMRAMADGDSFAPPSTIDDISVLDELEQTMQAESLGTGKENQERS